MLKIFNLSNCCVYFLVLLIFLGFSANSQLLKNSKSDIWIKSTNYPQSKALNPDSSIGNYPILDLSSNDIEQSFDKISNKRSGTLFLVIRTTSDTVSHPLLRMRSLTLYRDSASIEGKLLSIPSINSSASIVRLSYQGNLKRYLPLKKAQLNKAIQLGEVIYYSDVLNIEQSRLVESYLAMKYSINITENKNPKVRDYFDIYWDKAWNSETDESYNKEVLALGRLDRIKFLQTQTFSSDSKTFKLSLSNASHLGEMPDIGCSDKSLLLLSKRNIPKTGLGCGATTFLQPWKLRFINWKSSARYVFLTVDSIIDGMAEPVLTDGITSTPLKFEVLDGKTKISIPLPLDTTTKDFYIAWTNASNHCNPLCDIIFPNCNLTEGDSKSLQIHLEEEALPAELTLINLETKEKIKAQIQTPSSFVEGLDKGRYELRIVNKKMELSDEIFVFEDCQKDQTSNIDNQNMNGLEYDSQGFVFRPIVPDKHKSALKDGYHDKGIVVFPNPGEREQEISFNFFELNNQHFHIEIVDSKGRRLDLKRFTPSENQSIFRYKFIMDGSYIVRFISENFVDTKHIIIF